MRLSGDSRRIELTYAPGEFVDRFGCSFFITPTAEGFVGDTKGANCSFALRRPVHPWKIEAGASEIVVTDLESGEIHRLARVAEQ